MYSNVIRELSRIIFFSGIFKQKQITNTLNQRAYLKIKKKTRVQFVVKPVCFFRCSRVSISLGYQFWTREFIGAELAKPVLTDEGFYR